MLLRLLANHSNLIWGLGIGDWAQSPIPNPHPQIKASKLNIKDNLVS